MNEYELIYTLEELQEIINNRKIKANEIQSNFSFVIPEYLIDEIIEKENAKNYGNLHALINLATLNGRITEENAISLKKYYPYF